MSAFYNPVSAGRYKLGLKQENKAIEFTTIDGVFIPESKIEFYLSKSLIKTSDLNNDLSIDGTNSQGSSKTLTASLNGVDFSLYKGAVLNAKCTFFIDGDVEVIFDLQII